MLYFLLYVVVLALLLFFPISKLIWVFSVRRLQRKLKRELNETEIAGQMSRARFLSVFMSLLFSFLFNLNLMGLPTNG